MSEHAHPIGTPPPLLVSSPPVPSLRGGRFRSGFLDRCAIERRSQDIPTDGPIEAALMISAMLKHARGLAYFQCGRTIASLANAPEPYLDQIRFNTQQFLARPHAILKLIVEASKNVGPDPFGIFCVEDNLRTRVERRLSEDRLSTGTFLVASGRTFWMASAEAPKMGLGNFNDPAMASELICFSNERSHHGAPVLFH